MSSCSLGNEFNLNFSIINKIEENYPKIRGRLRDTSRNFCKDELICAPLAQLSSYIKHRIARGNLEASWKQTNFQIMLFC